MTRSSNDLSQAQPGAAEQSVTTYVYEGDAAGVGGVFIPIHTLTDQEYKQIQQTANSAGLGHAVGQLLNREASGVDQALSNAVDPTINFGVVAGRRSVGAVFTPAANPSIDAQLLGSFAGNVGDVCISGGTHLIHNGAYFVGGTAVTLSACATYAEVRLTTNSQLRSLNQIVATAMPEVRDTVAQHVGGSLAGSVAQASINEIKPEDVRAFVGGVVRAVFGPQLGPLSTVAGQGSSAGVYLRGLDRPVASLCNLARQAVANVPGQIAGATTGQIVAFLNGAISNDVDSRMPVPPTAFETNWVYPLTSGAASAYAAGTATGAFNTAAASVATGGLAVAAGSFFVPTVVAAGTGIVVCHTVRTLFRSQRPGLPAPGPEVGAAPGGDGQDGDRPGSEQPRSQQGL